MPLPKSLLTAAILGTDQSILDTAPIEVRDVIPKTSIPSPQARLLATAAGLKLRDRAGWLPSVDSSLLPEPSEPESQHPCSPRAVQHLQLMLKGKFKDLLPEWLDVIKATGQRIPEEAAFLLLEEGRKVYQYRDAIWAVLGSRGRWIGEAVPDKEWDWFHPRIIDRWWQNGSIDDRVQAVRFLRRIDPNRARDLVEDAWETENSIIRKRLLSEFSAGLSMDDEPFLETRFKDNSTHIRKYARDFLKLLPWSRFRERMFVHAVPLLELIDRNGVMMIELNPPDHVDEDLIQEGIASKHSSPLEVSRNIIAYVAPRYWCEHWGLSIDDFLLAIANNPDNNTLLFTAFTEAAYNSQDTIFAEQLFPYVYSVLGDKEREWLVPTLSPQRIEIEAINLLQTHHEGFHNGHLAMPLLFTYSNVWRLRSQIPASPKMTSARQQWSVALTRALLVSLKRYFAGEEVRIFGLSNTRTLLQEIAKNIPIKMRHAYLKVLSVDIRPRNSWRESVDQVRKLLDFRAEMLDAIHEGLRR